MRFMFSSLPLGLRVRIDHCVELGPEREGLAIYLFIGLMIWQANKSRILTDTNDYHNRLPAFIKNNMNDCPNKSFDFVIVM